MEGHEWARLFLIAWLLAALLAAGVARDRDRSAFGWLVLGLLFGPLALVAVRLIGRGTGSQQATSRNPMPPSRSARRSSRQKCLECQGQMVCQRCGGSSLRQPCYHCSNSGVCPLWTGIG